MFLKATGILLTMLTDFAPLIKFKATKNCFMAVRISRILQQNNNRLREELRKSSVPVMV